MQLKTLTIRRADSWESEKGLKATANFEGPGGKLEIELAPGFIVKVLALIEEDAALRAKKLARSVETAMIDATDTARLIEADKPLAITEEKEPF